jgi:hypothetical protein
MSHRLLVLWGCLVLWCLHVSAADRIALCEWLGRDFEGESSREHDFLGELFHINRLFRDHTIVLAEVPVYPSLEVSPHHFEHASLFAEIKVRTIASRHAPHSDLDLAPSELDRPDQRTHGRVSLEDDDRIVLDLLAEAAERRSGYSGPVEQGVDAVLGDLVRNACHFGEPLSERLWVVDQRLEPRHAPRLGPMSDRALIQDIRQRGDDVVVVLEPSGDPKLPLLLAIDSLELMPDAVRLVFAFIGELQPLDFADERLIQDSLNRRASRDAQAELQVPVWIQPIRKAVLPDRVSLTLNQQGFFKPLGQEVAPVAEDLSDLVVVKAKLVTFF